MGGQFLLPINAEHRKGAGVFEGDLVDVKVVLDLEPRAIENPSDFAASLEQAADARRPGIGVSKKRSVY
ncbi:DUF1905 domain-containing protein [Cohnella sp. CFH 77786]|uniref:DUF1905 domain-containing protein n=1 Tax=Cohnella sp. CFH 77786 TaxID=2662265 RepID=UPI001C60BB51|nr:DUF1905 domain-containing protein [Cohnella sp. CFH 77786]